MENTRMKWAVKAAGAGALALMMAVPSFAQSRNDRNNRNEGRNNDRGQTQDRRRDDSSSRTYRENERVSARGRVSSFTPERDGYRVQLDRGRESYWVPGSYFRNRGRNLQVGISIALGGIFRRGAVYVDAVSWPEDRGYGGGYDNEFVGGIVERVDYRRGTADIREDRSGRVIRVEFHNSTRRDRLSLDDVRRGDYVELSGSWSGRESFEVYDIESVRASRR
jgi:hypothetical protein